MLGKKLAAGGFGTVYRGDLMEEDGDSIEVVIKKVIFIKMSSLCGIFLSLLSSTNNIVHA